MFTEADASLIAATYYGITGSAARLPGEYDANFHFTSNEGKEFLLKISHVDEQQDVVMLQNEILQTIEHANPPFAAQQLLTALSGEKLVRHAETSCFVRLFSFVPGKLMSAVRNQQTTLLSSLGAQLGYLCKTMQPVRHAAAQRYLKWDLKQYHWIEQHLSLLTNSEDRSCVEYFIHQFAAHAAPVLPSLRHSVIHNDVNDYNIVVTDDAHVAGFIDFGDAIETATICELAIALTYAMMDKTDPLAAAAIIISSFHAVFPLQSVEIDVLFDLICMRLCVSVVNSALRKQENPEDGYLVVSERPAWALLKKLRSVNRQDAQAIFRNACAASTAVVQQLRDQYLSKNLGLSYQQPLHIIRGERQYLYDVSGRQYLDGVNNVCHVGHCHPRVVAAGQQQMSVLNTNTRYLHENIVRFAERLTSTLPSSLEVCFFVNSGSEANELALRLAAAHTRRGEWLVMDHGYYGSTTTLINLSPYKFNSAGGNGKPANVHILPQPDCLRDTSEAELPLIDSNIAALLCEAMPSCGGQVVLPPQYLQRVYQAVRHAGGVCIADEIQTGLGRMGTHFWAFETHDVIPDIVTIGKPLGNGHPIGAVVTTRAIAESFCNGMEYFNTFGGNPVSCAIGLAVLDVIADENLQHHALTVGNHLKQRLQQLMHKHAVIGDVRGSGLFLGIEFVTDKQSLRPAPDIAKAVVNHMLEQGILLSVDGPLHNVIKFKPPMVFSLQNADELVAHLDAILSICTL